MQWDQSRREMQAVYWSARERWGELTKDDLHTVLGQLRRLDSPISVLFSL